VIVFQVNQRKENIEENLFINRDQTLTIGMRVVLAKH
jgi:hypothetical protein